MNISQFKNKIKKRESRDIRVLDSAFLYAPSVGLWKPLETICLYFLQAHTQGGEPCPLRM